MLASAAKGEISARFTQVRFFFAYEGLEWLPYLGDGFIYGLYVALPLAALGIALPQRRWARWAVAVFGLGFTYLHLIDSTNYINHYYLVSLLCVLLWLALGEREEGRVYFWLRLIRGQIALVYVFAGIAKINADWLLQAQPLRIWLLQAAEPPYFGWLGDYRLAFAASWAAMLYDLTIPLWLMWQRTRTWAYAAVLLFHACTFLLFDIGIFPLLMPVCTLLFFLPPPAAAAEKGWNWRKSFAALYLCVQIYLPLRPYFWGSRDMLLYEDCYRWGWRVMLMEKEGIATFTVADLDDGRRWVVDNGEFLTPFQQKRLIQHAHIRQFAQFLATHYSQQYQIQRPAVYVDCRVVLNGSRSQLLLPPDENLISE